MRNISTSQPHTDPASKFLIAKFTPNTAMLNRLAVTFSLSMILMLGFFVRIRLVSESLNTDQTIYAFNIRQPLLQVLSSFGGQHFFADVLDYLSVHAFGESELTLRLPSLLAGMLGITCIYAVGCKMFGRLAGLIAAFFLAVSIVHVDYSVRTKGYTLLVLLALLSLLLFWRARSNPGSYRYWIEFTLVTALIPYSYLYGVLVLAIYGLYLSPFLVRDITVNRYEWYRLSPRSLLTLASLLASGLLLIVLLAPSLGSMASFLRGNIRATESLRDLSQIRTAYLLPEKMWT